MGKLHNKDGKREINGHVVLRVRSRIERRTDRFGETEGRLI